MLTTMLVAPLLGAFPQDPPKFDPPVRLKAGADYVKVEAPGFACPCWHDVDNDGKKDLVVGQFANGKIKVFKNQGDGKLAAGEWLMAEGAVAEVPDVS
jgi:hypothetical protein